MDEREQDSWLGPTLRQTPALASDACLDAETLAAWSDGGLSAKAAAAVELHASSCARCTALLAEIALSAPDAPPRHVWTPARLFRWLAPVAAAATAVAIWVAVPDRPVATVQPLPTHDLAGPVAGTRNPEPGTGNAEIGTGNRERGFSNQEPGIPQEQARVQPAPSARIDRPAAEERVQMRDELNRETAPPQALGAAADAVAEAPPAAAPVPPATAPVPASPAGALAATAAAKAQRSAFNSTGTSAESVSPLSPLIHWRIGALASIERSTNGGETWIKTTVPAPTVVGVRAVDGDRAVATTSENVQFYTTDGGLTWTRVQEKSAAPF